ncbi:MAG: tetratricopeptide repeat protein [Bryobacteraceae bacterium]
MAHKPPKEAIKEYRLAAAATRSGDPEKALRHLRRTVAIDPGFLEAQNNLGARLYQAGEYQEATSHLQAAADGDPSSPEICANLAVALAATDREGEGERWARRAFQLEPDSPKAQYVLAFILAKQNRNLPEALSLLERSVERFPSARGLYAVLLRKDGQMDLAAEQMRRYGEGK